MGDPYRRYGSSAADRVGVPRPSFPGQLSSEPTMFPSHSPYSSSHLPINPVDYAHNKMLPLRPGPYGLDDGVGVRHDPALSGLTAEAGFRGYPTHMRDPILMSQRPDVALGNASGTSELIHERPGLSPKVDGLLVNERPTSLPKVGEVAAALNQSNVLFVDGLPTDCSRREVGHLFRPFIGFKDIRVVHKEPRRSGDKAMVLCFVEFDDGKCALTAMEALQGYKFDDKKPESPELKIYFAHFPFRLPASENGEPQIRG